MSTTSTVSLHNKICSRKLINEFWHSRNFRKSERKWPCQCTNGIIEKENIEKSAIIQSALYIMRDLKHLTKKKSLFSMLSLYMLIYIIHRLASTASIHRVQKPPPRRSRQPNIRTLRKHVQHLCSIEKVMTANNFRRSRKHRSDKHYFCGFNRYKAISRAMKKYKGSVTKLELPLCILLLHK